MGETNSKGFMEGLAGMIELKRAQASALERAIEASRTSADTSRITQQVKEDFPNFVREAILKRNEGKTNARIEISDNDVTVHREETREPLPGFTGMVTGRITSRYKYEDITVTSAGEVIYQSSQLTYRLFRKPRITASAHHNDSVALQKAREYFGMQQASH